MEVVAGNDAMMLVCTMFFVSAFLLVGTLYYRAQRRLFAEQLRERTEQLRLQEEEVSP